MLPSKLFFKKPEGPMMNLEYEMNKKRDEQIRKQMEARYPNRFPPAVRPSVGPPKTSFQTLLNQDTPKPLPTAPGIVGGNVDWTNKVSSPFTHFLSGTLRNKRGMMSPPAIGSSLNLKEPHGQSIHTNM